MREGAFRAFLSIWSCGALVRACGINPLRPTPPTVSISRARVRACGIHLRVTAHLRVTTLARARSHLSVPPRNAHGTLARAREVPSLGSHLSYQRGTALSRAREVPCDWRKGLMQASRTAPLCARARGPMCRCCCRLGSTYGTLARAREVPSVMDTERMRNGVGTLVRARGPIPTTDDRGQKRHPTCARDVVVESTRTDRD